MGFHNLSTDIQPQAHAAHLAAAVELIKALEDVLAVL
jgi:hypothetical protein